MTVPTAQRIALIGAGNMAEALVPGGLKTGLCHARDLVAADPSAARRERFQQEFHIRSESDNLRAAAEADLIVLAVKPQELPEILPSLRNVLPGNARIVSIAAGFPTFRIESLLDGEPRVVRAMPNMPALIGAGVTAICAGRHAGAEDLTDAERLLGAVSRVLQVDESVMDAVTALSGSGPAYVFYLVNAWLNAAEQLGVDAGTARQLVIGTVSGAAQLLKETGIPARELQQRVTSKGGTTEAAFRVLDAHQFGAVFEQAVRAAAERAHSLAGHDPGPDA